MNKYILIAKNVVPVLTNIGATGIMTSAIAKVIPQNIGKITKLLYALGGVGIGIVVGNAAEKAMTETIDTMMEYLEKSTMDQSKEVEN